MKSQSPDLRSCLNTSCIFVSDSPTCVTDADCHGRNGQTVQVCFSGSHCWDHEPALVCLSEKTANDCSLFVSPLFSLCIYSISWSLLGTRIRCAFPFVFCNRDPRWLPGMFIYQQSSVCHSRSVLPPNS